MERTPHTKLSFNYEPIADALFRVVMPFSKDLISSIYPSDTYPSNMMNPHNTVVENLRYLFRNTLTKSHQVNKTYVKNPNFIKIIFEISFSDLAQCLNRFSLKVTGSWAWCCGSVAKSLP